MAKRMNGWIGAVVVVAMMMGAGGASGAVAVKEELKECALPHGEVVLPVAGTFEAANGEFLKLADGSLVKATSVWQAKKPDDVAAMQRGQVADLAFLSEDNGTLWAVSGRVVDLGMVYLSDLSGVKMDRPAEIRGGGGRPAGIIRGVQEGRTFLVETTEGKFALVRVLEVSKVGAVVQYVYQPTGGTMFEVPKGEFLDVVPWVALREPAKKVTRTTAIANPPTPTPVPTADRVEGQRVPDIDLVGQYGASAIANGVSAMKSERTSTVLEPPFSYHMRQQEVMIETRMKLLKGDAKTSTEIEKKVDAINELAEMRADAAAEEMVKQIAFLNPRGAGTEFQDSVHPCFAGLKKLGSAGSRAAVKGLREMDLGSESESLESPSYRAGLLALVIRAVEGDDVGLYILRRERAATNDVKRQRMYDQLISPEVKNIR